MKAWVPAHITGFFAAKRQEDPMRSGSIGCGLCLTSGAATSIEDSEETRIFLNGTESEAPVSRYVIDHLARGPVSVKTELEMPFGSGFGASGAGALGCAYAINAHFDLGFMASQAASVAHVAEVANGTGLGDVIAQNAGGLVVRLKPGAPGIGIIDRIPVQPLQVNFVVKGPISTREVLSDRSMMSAVNQAGQEALKELLKRPTLQDFMRLSRLFAIQSGLASRWAIDVIESVESEGGMASMVMLGDAVFAIDGEESLKRFGKVGTAAISQRGANLD